VNWTLLGVTRAVALDVSDYDCAGRLAQRLHDRRERARKALCIRHTRYMMFASDDVKLAIQAEGFSSSFSARPL
jgi:hypothetical protein